MRLDTDDHLFDLGECEHKSLRPPRVGFIGETVFAAYWVNLMAIPAPTWYDSQTNHQLLLILHDMPGTITQRHATVAATLVTWLGTNCGRAFLSDAQQLEQKMGRFAGHAYPAAWAIENARSSGINGGFRTVEHLLAPDDHFGRNSRGHGLSFQPELTADDLEVMEHVAKWLGTPEGKQFTAVCENEIKHRDKQKWREDMIKFNPEMAARLDQIEAIR
jgi:hypothetical protein